MADVTVNSSTPAAQQARGLRCVVFTTDLIGYCFTGSTTAFNYQKTTDGGANWGSVVSIASMTQTAAYSVWFDQWTPGDTGTLIHCWYFDSTTDTIFWRTLDTNGDTLGTQRNAFVGASAVASRATFCSGTKTRSGYLYCAFDIDSGTEHGLVRSTDSGTTWSSNLSATFVIDTGVSQIDQCICFPATGTGDNNDMWAIYQDGSADALTMKMWDSSAAAEVESATMQTMIENVTDGTGQMGFAGSVRPSDGAIIVVSMSDYNTATADMQVWEVTGVNAGSLTGITAKTDITTNMVDIYNPSVFINKNNGDIYVAYNGKRDGSEVLGTTTKVYYTKSTDGGTSWSSGDTAYMEGSAGIVLQVWTPLCIGRFYAVWRVAGTVIGNFVNSLTFVSGPTLQTLTGALSFVGADIFRTNRPMAGALSFAGAASKRISRTVAGALTSAGSLASVRFLLRVFTAALSFVGARRSVTGKGFTAALSFIGVQRDATFKALTATLSFIGATSRSIAHKMSAALAFVGALQGVRLLVRTLTATLSFVGAQNDRTSKALTGSLSFAGAIAKRSTRALAGALSFVGLAAKQGARSLSGALSFAGAISKRTAHTMAAALAFIGSFSSQLIGGAIQYTKALAASLLFVGAQTKFSQKRVTGALSFVGAAAKQIPRSFSAALNFVGTFTKAFPRVFTAALSFIGAQSDRTNKTFAGALSFVGTMGKTWARTFAAALAFAGTVRKSSGKALSAVLTSSGTIRRAIAHKMAAGLAFAGNFITQLVGGPVHYIQTLTAAILFSGTARRGTAHKMAAAVSFLGGVGRRFPRALTGALAFVGTLARRNVLNQLLTASLSFVGAQARSTRKALQAASVSFVGVFTKFVPGLALIFRNRRASRGIGI